MQIQKYMDIRRTSGRAKSDFEISLLLQEHSRFRIAFIVKYMTQLLLLGKFEYTGGLIFKVVLEC